MKGRLLLVEDEEEARCSLVRTLERQGYTCLTAATYDEAAAVLARETVPIDAAVVDIVLGDDDRGGLRVLPLIRALPGKPRVVVITAFADVSRVKEALNGGAATNITAVKHRLATYDPAAVQGSVLDRAEIDRQIELYRSRDADARRAIVGLQPKRAEVILAGACIVRTVMEKLGKQDLAVSDRGLRHGVLAERFGA